MIKLFQKIPLSIICVVPVLLIVISVSNAQSISENGKLNFAGFIKADTPTELYARQKDHSLLERSQLLQAGSRITIGLRFVMQTYPPATASYVILP